MTVDLNRLALRIAHRVQAIAIREGMVPVGKPDPDDTKRTGGDLRKSLRVSSLGAGSAVLGTNLAYARAVHEGRPALVIRPRKARALRWCRGGQAHFARRVFQPKRAGRPFLRNALDRFVEGVDGELAALGVQGELAETLAHQLRRRGLQARVATGPKG